MQTKLDDETRFARMRARVTKSLADSRPFEEAAFDRADAPYFQYLACQWIARASLEHEKGAPVSTTAGHIRVGLRKMRLALELGYRPTAWDQWDFVLAGIAAGDRPFVHLLTTLPRDAREEPSAPLYCLAALNDAVAALFHGRRSDAAIALEDARSIATVSGEATNPLEVLEAIHCRDTEAFRAAMRARLARYRAPDAVAPCDCLDLAGLGLSALARESGIVPGPSSSLVPLELLDVPHA